MTREVSNLKGIPFSLFLVMTLQFAVGGAVLPFMSMWLEEKGLSFSEISLIFSVASTTFLVFPFLWGMIADRYLPIEWMFFFLNGMAGVSAWCRESDRVWRVDAELCFFLFVLSPDIHSHQRVELFKALDPAQGTIRGGSCLGLGRVILPPGGLCLVVVSSECIPSIRSQGGDGGRL